MKMDLSWFSNVSFSDIALILFALLSILSNKSNSKNMANLLSAFSTNLRKRDLRDIANSDIDDLIQYHKDAILKLENLKKEKE